MECPLTMSDTPAQTATRAADDLFDKYTLPKIALAVILAASLVGAWVTTTLSGRGFALVAARWAYFVSLGVLTGGLLWKHAFVRPADLETGAQEYCAQMYDRFDRIATGSLVALAVSGAVVSWRYVTHLDGVVLAFGYSLVVGLLVVSVAVTTRRTGAVDDQFRSPLGVTALGLALVVTVGTAVLEVSLRGFDPAAAGVRTLHLVTFAVWLGGAVWNIYVAVPTGQQRPTSAVARAAGEQLERFRWAVRIIIPTLFLTGLYQAVDALGTLGHTYLGTTVGLAVLAKIGFIGGLVVIFKLCPMWRACSPIDGVCDLEDLGGTVSDDGDGTDEPGVTNGD